MSILIGYGFILLFFVIVIVTLEMTNRRSANFTDYAVAGRSFGSWFQTMAFLNTWLPGTMFIAFAGFSASLGVIGYYVITYSLLSVMFMFFMAQRVFEWGKKFNLRTQADFVGMRYNSKNVRILAAIIGVVSAFPWLILGLQSIGLVFHFLSFGTVNTTWAVIIGITVLALRQIWTVKMGMRGIVISDMIQGIIAYGIGGLIALGFIIWLMSQGFGFSTLPDSFYQLPGLSSDLGPLYYFSIVATGALGSWCWPDIFVRLFTANSAHTVRQSAVKAAPLMFLFLFLLLTMSMLAHHLDEVASAPDQVWFLTTKIGGPVILSLAGVAVLAAAVGNINALTAAIGTHTAQDIIHVNGNADEEQTTKTAKRAIVFVTLLAVIGALLTIDVSSGLLVLALASYQGIVQLAPALYLGIFWRKGNATGAIAGMVVGFITAVVCQIYFPYSIPALAGLTSGIVGLIVNAVIYVSFAYLKPLSSSEKARIDNLFDEVAR